MIPTFHGKRVRWGSIAKARYLRKIQTPTEKLLWRKLRDGRLKGLKFRRQVPIGRYVADFACMEQRLIIEIDGGVHAFKRSHDLHRDVELRALGFSILRFTNIQIKESMDSVLQAISNSLSFQGEG